MKIEPHYHCELCGHVIAKFTYRGGKEELNLINLMPVRVAIVAGPNGPGIGQIPAPVCNDCKEEVDKQPSKIVMPDGSHPRMN